MKTYKFLSVEVMDSGPFACRKYLLVACSAVVVGFDIAQLAHVELYSL